MDEILPWMSLVVSGLALGLSAACLGWTAQGRLFPPPRESEELHLLIDGLDLRLALLEEVEIHRGRRPTLTVVGAERRADSMSS